MLTLSMLLTVTLITGILLADSAKRYREASERQLAGTARTLSLAVDAEVGKAATLIRALAVSDALRNGDFKALDRQARQLRDDPATWIVIVDEHAQQKVNTYNPVGSPSVVAPKATFTARWNRASTEGRYVSNLGKGRVFPGWIVTVNEMAHDGAGRPYLITVAMKPEVISRLLAKQALPRGWYSVAFDSTGTILAHNLASEEFVGRPATPQAMSLIKAKRSGLIKRVDVGGSKSVAVLDRSALTGWSVAVTMPRAEATALLSRSLNLLALAVIAMLFVGAALSFFLARGTARAVETVVAAANRMGQGALVSAGKSTGLLETDKIAAAIEAASLQLRAREAELKALNETLEARIEETAARLVQAQKIDTLGQLTGGVAHDFNNLLSPIIGGLDRLQRGGLTEDRAQRAIAGALEAAERAKTLVHRLLAFARRQPLQPTAVDMAGAIGGVSELLSSTLGPRVEIRIGVETDLPPAKADPNQLELAILNLAVNARDAMPDGGVLSITAGRERVVEDDELTPGDYIRLAISDTGEGMDEEVRKRAVEPFFSTKGIGRGTGLGLSMVHGLAAQLGGALRLHSALGQGTTIELLLPVADSLPVVDEVSRPTKAVSEGIGAVLLVEDDALVRASTAAMLADLGYAVVETISAREALGVLESGVGVDAMVTDHLMPGMTGAELARVVRARWPDIRVLIISGYADVEHIAPDLPRLVKPFRQADLGASLAALAGQSVS